MAGRSKGATVPVRTGPPGMRCTTWALLAFGVAVAGDPITGIDVLDAFRRAGWKWTPVVFEDSNADYFRPLAGRPMSEVVPLLLARGGDYYVFSSSHAMALRGGALYDTASKTWARTKVVGVYLITKG